MNYYIYSLREPGEKEVKYVGCTTVKLNQRLSQHIWDANNKKSKKSIWIKTLLDGGKKPVIDLLEVCDETNWQQREMFYIHTYTELYNTMNGGTGLILNKSKASIEKSTLYKERKIDQFDLKGNHLKTWESTNKIAAYFSIYHTAINNALRGRAKTSQGFVWKYH